MMRQTRRIDYTGAWGTWSAGYHAPTLPIDPARYEALKKLQAARMEEINKRKLRVG